MLTLSTLPSSMVSREEDWPSPPVSPQHVGGAKAPCCPCFGASGGMNEEGRSNPMGTMIPPHQALGLPILGNLDPLFHAWCATSSRDQNWKSDLLTLPYLSNNKTYI